MKEISKTFVIPVYEEFFNKLFTSMFNSLVETIKTNDLSSKYLKKLQLTYKRSSSINSITISQDCYANNMITARKNKT